MKKLLTKNINVHSRQIEGLVRRDSVNVEGRTVEVVAVSTDNAGLRYGRFGPEFDDFGPFMEELSLEKKHIRLERFESGASPVLKDHNQWSIDNVIGVIEGVRISKTDGMILTVRFAEDEQSEIVWQKVRDGILKNVSIGYRVHKMEEIGRHTEKGEKTSIPIMRATDYEPLEISFVPIGFDAGANVRCKDNDQEELNNCTFLYRNMENNDMTEEELEAQRKAAAEEKRVADEKEAAEKLKTAEDKARTEGIEAEGKRQTEIRSRCAQAGFDQKATDELVAENLSPDEANKRIMDAWAGKGEDTPVDTRIENQGGKIDLGRAMVANLSARIMPDRDDVRTEYEEGNGNHFAGHTLFDMGRVMLTQAGVDTRGMSRMEQCEKMISFRSGPSHSTSDFPTILEDIQNKFLRKQYVESPQTFLPLVNHRPVSDFKVISSVQLGEGSDLLKVEEGAEYQLATVGEAGEKYVIAKYGRVYKFTLEMLMNDDLHAFMRMIGLFGAASSRLESDLFWAQITDNAALSDGVALFHADHNNLNSGAGAAAIGKVPLSDMRAATRKQVGIDGVKLNLIPKHLMVPAELETDAEELVTKITPTKSGDVNVFSTTSKLNLIVEPRLDDSSTTAFYTATSKEQVDLVEMARMEGQETPTMSMKEGFSTDSIEFKGRSFVAFKVQDFRGFQKNDGA